MKVVMAYLMPNRPKTGAETAAWACKVIFLVIGVASTVVFAAKLAIPYFAHLLSHSLPSRLCKSIVPRYLFIAVNSIIIIVWKLHDVQHHHDHHENQKSSLASHDPLPPKLIILDSSLSIHESPSSVAEPCTVTDLSEALEIEKIISNEQAIRSDNDQASDPWPPPPDVSSEDPLLENDTMDAMWKAIMGGGGTSPDKNQNIKKSDTSERSTEATTTTTTTTPTPPTPPPTPTPALTRASAGPARRFGKSETFREDIKVASHRKEMRKSETFRESSSSSSPAAAAPAATGWRGRDRLVIGRDELFNKVEAFIKMNYDQLRLQRQESEQRYVEKMVNAAY